MWIFANHKVFIIIPILMLIIAISTMCVLLDNWENVLSSISDTMNANKQIVARVLFSSARHCILSSCYFLKTHNQIALLYCQQMRKKHIFGHIIHIYLFKTTIYLALLFIVMIFTPSVGWMFAAPSCKTTKSCCRK